MWTTKYFKTLAAMQAWIAANQHRVQWTRIFVNNKPYALEYRKLRIIG